MSSATSVVPVVPCVLGSSPAGGTLWAHAGAVRARSPPTSQGVNVRLIGTSSFLLACSRDVMRCFKCRSLRLNSHCIFDRHTGGIPRQQCGEVLLSRRPDPTGQQQASTFLSYGQPVSGEALVRGEGGVGGPRTLRQRLRTGRRGGGCGAARAGAPGDLVPHAGDADSIPGE